MHGREVTQPNGQFPKARTLYDAARNEYTLFRHNLTTDEANEVVREFAARRFGLFVLDQHAKHSAKVCRADELFLMPG